MEMEITWGGVGIKEKTEEIVKKKEQEKNLTPWEKYIDKQKQKKKDDKKKVKPAAEEGSLDSVSVPFFCHSCVGSMTWLNVKLNCLMNDDD